MSLLSRLDAKFGRYSVPGLVTYLIMGQIAVFAADFVQQQQGGGPRMLELIRLVPQRVLEGEVWRLFTFLIQPPRVNLLWLFFYWYLLYFMAGVLEQHWGSFRLNLYLIVGWLATVVVAFFVPPGAITNAYLYTSLFLAFAHLFPDFELRLYVLLPVKVKWLALLTWLGFLYAIYVGGWPQLLIVAATVADFFLFLGGSIWDRTKSAWRRRRFRQRVETGRAIHAAMVHRCAVCGLSSDKSPKTQFRYCSRCEGDNCYCPEHLQDHEHTVRRESATSR